MAFFLYRKATGVQVGVTHHSTHYCLPCDLDIQLELSNGRALPIYNMDRLPMAKRAGLIATLRRCRW